MSNEAEENYNRYLSRIKYYKEFGYDNIYERNFIIDISEPLKEPILEIGTGKGYLSVELAKRGYEITTIDILAEDQNMAKMNIEHLGLKNKVRFLIADAGCMPFEDQSFNVLFSVNSLHHFEDSEHILYEFLRVVKEDGKIVLSDFNDSGFALIDKVHESEGREHHVSGWRINAAEKLFLSSGFFVRKYSTNYQDTLIVEKRKAIK